MRKVVRRNEAGYSTAPSREYRTNALKLLEEIERLVADGKISGTVAPLLSALRERPEDPDLHLSLTKILFALGLHTEAREASEEALRLAPQSAEAIYLRAGILYSSSEYLSAAALLEAAVASPGIAASRFGRKIAILFDQTRANMGLPVPDPTDPDYPHYAGQIDVLKHLPPVPIVPEADPDTLPALQKSMLAAYRAGATAGDGAGKSVHWDRFRKDFERVIATVDLWERFRAYGLTQGLDDDLVYLDPARPFAAPGSRGAPDDATAAPFAVARLYERTRGLIVSLIESLGHQQVADLAEAEIGSPLSFRMEALDVPVNYHDLSCVYFADRISRQMPDVGNCRILEIGGGYGAMAAKLRLLKPSSQIVLVDLPESSAFQHYYLSRRFPGATILTATDLLADPGALEKGWDFLLLPNTRTELASGLSFDFALNVRSFMEMTPETISFYCAWFGRALTPGGVCYLANRPEKQIGSDRIRFDDYPIPRDWTLQSEEVVPAQTHILERVYRSPA